MNIIIYFLFICFLEAFHCYVNVALNKPAFQQNPFYPNDNIGDASNAVDGKKSNLSRNGGQCAVSAGRVTATWWVNLTSIHSIQNITIYYMTDNKPWGATNPYAQSFFGFSVYVSNTTDNVNGSLCFKDENFTLETIPAVITAICPVYGQYVIYYNERLPGVTYPENNYYAENNVCEVEVYGCPPTGCYGSNNSFPCPDDNCHYCHKETGTCQVCKPGYKGQHCELECETGKYGINCSKSCGNCHNQPQCHNIHGFCSDGCSAGYKGSLCTEKCAFGKYGIKCSETCGNCRNQSHCQNVDGFCLWGCSAGYKGFFCTELCDQTFHGINCSQKCSTNCSSQACNHVTGKCIDSSKTDEVLSNPVITGGISAGSAIILVVIGIGVFYGIRKRKKEDESSVGSTCGSESTTTSSLSQKYDNIERGDHKSVSPKLLHTKGTKSETTIENGDGDTDTDDEIHMENPYGDHYVNNESIKEISISNLWNVIMEKSKSENDGFKKEYATLLYGERHPCEIGKHPENIPKNRFRTTFVYDHSRVILENQASDYINANFIDGLRQIHEYIATQGPKPITVDDFWMMIWQENVVQIVMLTNLKEGARKKCAKYWPDKNAENDCNIFIIQTLEEKQYANYVTRKILMTNKKENEKRTITQYHYITWPDHGVPDPLCLLSFHNRVTRTKTFRHKGPTLVHCSAGIGRTGTYIAIDALHKEVQQENKINIAEFVTKMREKRMNMVQTYEQYKTIFLTLYEMSKAPATVHKTTEFVEKLDRAKLDTVTNVSFLRDEFQKLMSVRPQKIDDSDKMLSEGECLSTTQYENVIIRMSSAHNRESNIDGIFINSFTNQNAFIVTHCQPADGVLDFLSLITDYVSEVIVFMEPFDSTESTDTWMPTTSISSKSVPPFTIQLQQEDTKEIKWHRVEITKEDTDFQPRKVHLVAPTQDITSDYAQTVSQILGLVSFAQKIIEKGPIIVVSKDGADLCGVFCAVFNLIQQLTMDEEIDVFSVVRLLQTRRPELCATLEDYEMINHAMMTFIQLRTDENTYNNQ